ncbi:MAG: tetratricopeptide repeat protein [Anaerolineae bacterium]|nr:tetratricopeptide repeat protein [Anaerolineae bacterium]
MSGNRQIYEQAMQMGHSAAWDQEWDKAIASYGRAVQEMPEDPAAHNSLGLALLNARRLEDALKVYTRAHQLSQDDPIPLEKSADVLERLGRLKEAAQQYVNVAEIYLAQRDLDKAIGNWERAVQLNSSLVQIYQRLALAYERTGAKNAAIRAYLTLAFNFQRGDRSDLARQAVERALRINPQNPAALNTLQAIEAGRLISPEMLDTGELQPKRAALKDTDDDKWDEEDQRRAVGESNPRGPIGEAVDLALSALADHVFSSGSLSEGSTHAIQAITLQQQGSTEEAVGAYERALASDMRHAGVYMNLGSLYFDLDQHANALPHLEQAACDPVFAAGAMHGICMIFHKQGRTREAAHYLLEALKSVDVGLALSEDEAAQIATTYDRMLDSVATVDQLLLQRYVESFIKRVMGADWKQRVAKTRRQLEERIATDKVEGQDLFDLGYIDDKVTEGLTRIDRYVREGLLSLAIDQAHHILESAPDFLPAHQRIGQILLEKNNIPAAMVKYNLIAETYVLRDELDRAAQILVEALKIAPMDITLHKSLIGLLREQQRWTELLDQYVDLAVAYHQVGDLDAARATYLDAIDLAREHSPDPEQLANLMHRLGEIDVQRLILRQAMQTYEELRKLDPNDDRARRQLVDLNYRLGDALSAIRELDGLLRVYARQRRAGEIIQVLEEHVMRYPNDMALRSRLAAVYRQTGNVAKAIEQLDALAELQLESGLREDALVTIQRIISLNPPQVEGYEKLLQQLSG